MIKQVFQLEPIGQFSPTSYKSDIGQDRFLV